MELNPGGRKVELGAPSLRVLGRWGPGLRETVWVFLASCTGATLPDLGYQGRAVAEPPAGARGQHSLMLGCPETLRRMSTSFCVASRSSCTSSELKLPPPVMSMIFTAYSWHVGLWMQRLTTLLTPLGVQRTDGPGGPSPPGEAHIQATAERSCLVPQLPVSFGAAVPNFGAHFWHQGPVS